MKKVMSFILVTALTAVVAMPAFATHETRANGDGTWTTSGSDASLKGKMMTMVAYAPSNQGITVDSIQYIEQTVADTNGAYAFEKYIPKDLPTTDDHIVLVGGETLDEPVHAGKIEKPAITKVAVSGKAAAIGNAAITVTFKQNDINIPVHVVGGAFEAELEPGTYHVEYTAAGYLSHTITGVPVAGDLVLKDIRLLAGDVNASGDVSIEDIGFVVGAYGDETLYHITKDFDASHDISVEDIDFAVANYQAVAKVEAYAAN